MGSQPSQQSQVSSSASRRLQRSTRITVSVSLLVAAALLLVTAGAVGAGWLWMTAAVAALALGAASTKIMHSELLLTRKVAARDRARQASEYADLSARRSKENSEFAEAMTRRINEREEALEALEEALTKAQKHALEQTRKLNAEARRADVAERDQTDLVTQLASAEDRAAEAIVRVAELESEIDGLRSELADWKAGRNRTSRTA